MFTNKMTHNFKALLSALVLIPALLLATPAALAHSTHEHGTPDVKRSLYDRLGGLPVISVVVSDFLDLMVPDEQLNKNRNINVARKQVAISYLKYQVTSMVCQATGGPCKYTGKTMKESHEALRIKQSEWDRMIVLFKQVATKHRVSGKETKEILSIFDSVKADIVMPLM